MIVQVTALAITCAVGFADEELDDAVPTALEEAVDDAMDFLDDPLSIATPWENKKEDA